MVKNILLYKRRSQDLNLDINFPCFKKPVSQMHKLIIIIVLRPLQTHPISYPRYPAPHFGPFQPLSTSIESRYQFRYRVQRIQCKYPQNALILCTGPRATPKPQTPPENPGPPACCKGKILPTRPYLNSFYISFSTIYLYLSTHPSPAQKPRTKIPKGLECQGCEILTTTTATEIYLIVLFSTNPHILPIELYHSNRYS